MLKVKEIKLTNYRCFQNTVFSFENGINLLVGKNGTGKTSVVEAISYLFSARSFRRSREIDCILQGERYFSITGTLENNNKINKTSFYYDINGKKVSINGELVKKLSDFVTKNSLVSFSPDDLLIIKGSPADRRTFLNNCLSQIDSLYSENMNKYQKIVKQRNEYLKNVDKSNIDFDMLDVFDLKIVEYGSYIIKKREYLITYLCKYIQNNMQLVSGNIDNCVIRYCPKTNVEDFAKEIKKRREHDIYLQTTTVGPHRDDVVFLINDTDASSFASQGQIRSAVIALKISFYQLLKELNKTIVIIMDDVLSELDENRKNNLVKLLNNGEQIFLTCTNTSNITKEILENCNLITIKGD